MLCTKCNQWIHGRYSKLKKVTQRTAKFFVGNKFDKAANDAGKVQQEIMCIEVGVVKGFCYLGNRSNASGGFEATVTASTRVRWKKFKDCGEIKRFSL